MSLYSEYYLAHYGIKGQKWGVRRFETKDGKLTPAGKERYDDYGEGKSKKEIKRERKEEKKALKTAKKIQAQYEEAGDSLGRADYYRAKGDEVAKNYTEDEKVLRKSAEQFEKNGAYIRAALANRLADRIKSKGDEARKAYDELADEYIESSEYFTQKASKIATKHNVELGKATVDAIMKESRAKGVDGAKSDEERAKWREEWDREWEEWKNSH